MKACIPRSLALLLACVAGVHAQHASQLRVGTPVRATLAANDTLRYELDLPKSHFVAGRVDQDGVDATVTIMGPPPAGRRVQRAARVGRGAPEAFAFATDTSGGGRYVIEVTPATAGKGGACVCDQNGQHPGRRVVEKAPVDLTSFAGRYFSEELETFYDLSVEGGQLVIRHRRFGPVTLTHTSGDSFSGTLPVSLVVFRRDAQGNVTGFDAGNGRARGIMFTKVSR